MNKKANRLAAKHKLARIKSSIPEVPYIFWTSTEKKLWKYSALSTDPLRTDEEDMIVNILRADLIDAGIEFDTLPCERE